MGEAEVTQDESEAGAGTSGLPPVPMSEPEEVSGLSIDDRGTRHVLLVEDEDLVALATTEELRRLGWTVIGPATTLDEAQILVSSGIRLDAAVLDVHLRGRWAHALAEQLAERGVPFVVCTGWEMVDPDGRFAGAPLIAKPISPDRLGAALDELLVATSRRLTET